MTAANAEKPGSDERDAKPKSNSKTYRITHDKSENKWRVKADGAKRAIGYYNTKVEAEQKVKELKANNKEAKVSVHKMDGRFQKLK
ncbi:MAG: hypothetical protein PWR17_875 [Candidatus Methanomethylophilaceae archaeon]|nr:hypothetical protein [Candidatus Methanomethylophilaceae archaeon]